MLPRNILLKTGVIITILVTVLMEDYSYAMRVLPGKRAFRGWDGHDIDPTMCPSKDKMPMMMRNINQDLVCLAGYPIRVTSDKMINSLVGLTNATPRNMSAGCYFVIIPFFNQYTGVQGLSGNYSCTSTSDPQKTNSTYLFPPENGGPAFVQPPMNVVRINKANATKLRIPCVAATKNLTDPILLQLDLVDAMWKKVAVLRNWTTHYNPSTGFEITFPNKSASDPSKLVGNFMCRDSVSLREVQYRVVNADFIVNPPSQKLTFDKGNLSVECYSGSPVYIKLLNYSSPIQIIENIDNSNRSTLSDEVMHGAGYVHFAKAVFQSTDSKAQGQIICINSLTEKTLFTWTFDNEYACQCNWTSPEIYRFRPTFHPEETHEFGDEDHHPNGRFIADDYSITHSIDVYSGGQLHCGVEKAKAFDYKFTVCQNPVDCFNMKAINLKAIERIKVQQQIAPLKYRKQQANRRPKVKAYESFVQLQPGYILCAADGYASHIDVQVDLNKNMYFNPGPKDIDVRLEIRVYRKSYFVGDNPKFTCYGSGYNLISPILWAVEYTNGSMEFIQYDGIKQSSFGELEDYFRADGVIMTRNSFLTMKKDTKAVWCYAKKSLSSDWAYASVNVKVQDIPIAQDPPPCPTDPKSSAIILSQKMAFFNPYGTQNRRNPARIITGRDMEIRDPVGTVTLYCISNIPVEWTKDGEKISTSKRTRASCRKSDNSTVQNRLYKISTSISVSSSNGTGNYTCRSSTSHFEYDVSTYIYMLGKNHTMFVNEGHHYQVVHKVKRPDQLTDKDTNTWALLPCKTNQPNLVPYIFIDYPNREKLDRIGLDNSYINFDPKVGFHIDVTVDFIKNDTTTFICSDIRDGSFIGNLITLHRVYDPLPTTTTPVPTAAPTIRVTNGTTQSPSINHTIKTPETIVAADTGSSAGFIVCIVLLLSLCMASFLITFKLYKKLNNEQKTNPSSTSHELDWASAVKHSSDSAPPLGNNLGSLIEATNNYNNATNNGYDNDNYEDESLPHMNENRFNYKKF